LRLLRLFAAIPSSFHHCFQGQEFGHENAEITLTS